MSSPFGPLALMFLLLPPLSAQPLLGNAPTESSMHMTPPSVTLVNPDTNTLAVRPTDPNATLPVLTRVNRTTTARAEAGVDARVDAGVVSGVVTGVVIGVMRDSAGMPLSNVDVIVSGTNRMARTGDDGRFAIRGLPNGTHHLDFLRIGYVSAHEVITVVENGPDLILTVTRRVAAVRLSSVNVTATPVGSDALNLTQASSQLSGKELQRALSTSIGLTLA